MNIDTWAVVLATAVGPIAAVLISLWLQSRQLSAQRQHWVFSTLMGLRGATLSADHVRALNVVQVAFHKCPKVIGAWKTYLGFLETKPSDDGGAAWTLKNRDLLNDLLVQMSQAVGISGDAVDISRGGYYPLGWSTRDDREEAIQHAKKNVADFLLSQEFADLLKRLKAVEYRARLGEVIRQESHPE